VKDKKQEEYSSGFKYHDELIRQMTELCSTFEHRDLIEELITTVVKFGLEKAENVDLKLLNRAMKELRCAFKMYSPYRGIKKVAVFGSARPKPDAIECLMAESFSKKIVKKNYMVVTGSGPGVMKAANKGAGIENSFGLSIKLPFEQESNPYIDEEKLIMFKYFFTRKLMFIKETNATVIFPGGFGTLDEAVESITLFKTGKCAPRPIIFVEPEGFGYWGKLLDFMKTNMLEYNYIGEDSLKLFSYVTSEDEAIKIITDFYKIYHSIRRVREYTVLRLNNRISDEKLKFIKKDFKSLFIGGKIEQREALEPEIAKSEYPELPRLVFKLDEIYFGRLRELIDVINE
jgi:uncharacterized protein (TIGR00730 family)